jgi:AraC-like DNA-binding protein
LFNYYDRVRSRPEIYNQLSCKELLFVHYKCPNESKITDLWSQHNYIQYILSGKKAFHTPDRSWYFKPGDAFFVKKGASITEKFFEEPLCIITFFIPDSYLQALVQKNKSLLSVPEKSQPDSKLLIPLPVTEIMSGYIESVIPYFYKAQKPSEELLELKFRELLMTIFTDPENHELNSYLQSIASPQYNTFQEVMEANCFFNLSLSDYARLLNLSLSSFKRHFVSVYKTTPGQWLQDRRLNYACQLLISTDKQITDISFESGFENSTHFSHLFKNRFGVSPLNYRKEALAGFQK